MIGSATHGAVRRRYAIVVIAASAGGIQALQTLLATLRARAREAYRAQGQGGARRRGSR
jgi:chemotaxis response regulator CheB